MLIVMICSFDGWCLELWGRQICFFWWLCYDLMCVCVFSFPVLDSILRRRAVGCGQEEQLESLWATDLFCWASTNVMNELNLFPWLWNSCSSLILACNWPQLFYIFVSRLCKDPADMYIMWSRMQLHSYYNAAVVTCLSDHQMWLA